MDIDPNALDQQYRRALAQWPWLHPYEDFARLPYMMLFADGSRETNLTNEIGDSGFGHGVWQLDSRSHEIPVGFDSDVQAQAQKASEMLVQGFEKFGSWGFSLAYYNSGQTNDLKTAHHDYAADVLARMLHLQQAFPKTVHGFRLLELTTPYMVGNDVKWFQHAWNLKPWKPKLTEDGVYGPVTAQAVKVWQGQHHLTADGIVGPQTLAAMARVVL